MVIGIDVNIILILFRFYLYSTFNIADNNGKNKTWDELDSIN